MKHNIRINGEVKEIDCELGSGILDQNGHELWLDVLKQNLEVVGHITEDEK